MLQLYINIQINWLRSWFMLVQTREGWNMNLGVSFSWSFPLQLWCHLHVKIEEGNVDFTIHLASRCIQPWQIQTSMRIVSYTGTLPPFIASSVVFTDGSTYRIWTTTISRHELSCKWQHNWRWLENRHTVHQVTLCLTFSNSIVRYRYQLLKMGKVSFSHGRSCKYR